MPWGAAAAAVAGGVVAHNNQPDSGGQVGRAEQFKFNTGLFNTEFDHRRGQDFIGVRAKGPLNSIQTTNLNDARSFFRNVRSNEDASLANELGGEFLAGINAFDPMQVAQMQFDQFNPILQDQFDEDRLNMEERLFSQGRLGSTRGANDFNALLDSQEDSRRKLLFDSFGQGLAAQNQQFNMAQGLLALDPTLRGLFQGLGNNSLRSALDVQNAGLNQLAVGAGLTGGSSGGANTGINIGQQVGAGLLNSGVNGLTQGLDGLFQSSTDTQSPFTNNTINGFTSTTAGR